VLIVGVGRQKKAFLASKRPIKAVTFYDYFLVTFRKVRLSFSETIIVKLLIDTGDD